MGHWKSYTSPPCAKSKRRALIMMTKGLALWFPTKIYVVLPSGCGGTINGLMGLQLDQYIDTPSMRARMMIQALPCLLKWEKTPFGPWINCQAFGVCMWPTRQCGPSASSSLHEWGRRNLNVVLKDPMVWESMLYYGGGLWLSTLTLQVPSCPTRELGSCIGRPNPWQRPTCNHI